MISTLHIGIIAATRAGQFWRFDASGADESWEVPAGVTSIRAHLFGAAGGGGIYSSGYSGAGGYTVGDLSVTPGETLTIRVGVGGGAPVESPGAGGVGGWPGGGDGSFGDTFGGGGGGYSGIFRGSTPLLIAGGGAGHAGFTPQPGSGGGTTGEDGSRGTSTGGSQSAGGTSGGGGTGGGYLQGAHADSGNRTIATSRDSGGGGGGYYGGGADNVDGGSGSGGSGYIGSASNAATYQGYQRRHVSTSAPTEINGETVYPRGEGVDSVGYGTAANAGNDGVIWIQSL